MLMTNDEGSKRKVSLENQIKAKNNNLQNQFCKTKIILKMKVKDGSSTNNLTCAGVYSSSNP